MGSSDSNCCGAKPGFVIPRDDPDSGTMGRNRRNYQNTDASLLKRSQSLSQDTFYAQPSTTESKHTFEIHGNFTVSSTNSHSLPYGITLNINGLHDVNNIYLSTDTNGRNTAHQTRSHSRTSSKCHNNNNNNNNGNAVVDWSAIQWVPPPQGEPSVPQKHREKKRQKRYIAPEQASLYQKEPTPPILEQAAMRPEIANYAQIAIAKEKAAAAEQQEEEEEESESISDLSNVDDIMEAEAQRNEMEDEQSDHQDDQEVMDKVKREKQHEQQKNSKEESDRFSYDLDDMQTLHFSCSAVSSHSDSNASSSSSSSSSSSASGSTSSTSTSGGSAQQSHGDEDSDIDSTGSDQKDMENANGSKGSNLLTPQQVDTWNKKEIDRHEVEMLREMRRLSLTNINVNIKDTRSGL